MTFSKKSYLINYVYDHFYQYRSVKKTGFTGVCIGLRSKVIHCRVQPVP